MLKVKAVKSLVKLDEVLHRIGDEFFVKEDIYPYIKDVVELIEEEKPKKKKV